MSRPRRGRADRPHPPARFHLRRPDARGLSRATRSPRRCSPTACTLVGRSFKYHRPRGILTAGSEEPNALVELRHGRAPRAQHARDRRGAVRRAGRDEPEPLAVARLRPAGASTTCSRRCSARASTTRPSCGRRRSGRRLYEPLIRRAAGLGGARRRPIPDRYEKAHAFCDLLVIGAGPAGLMAALAAGRAGARVILADEDFLSRRAAASPNGTRSTARRARPGPRRRAAELASLPNVRLMTRTTVFGVYDGGTYGALERVGRPSAGAGGLPAAPALLADRRAAGGPVRPARSSGRSCSAATIGRA